MKMSEDKKIFHSTLRFIANYKKKQKKEGYWNDSQWSELHQSIISNQMGLLIAKLDWKILENSKSKLIEHLGSVNYVTKEYSYWRFLPLFYLRADEIVLLNAFNSVDSVINSNVYHHQHSPIKEFYCNVVWFLFKKDNPKSQSIITEFKKEILKTNNEYTIPKNTYILYNLVLRNALTNEDVNKILKSLKEELDSKKNQISNIRHSYGVLNFIDLFAINSPLIRDENRFILLNCIETSIAIILAKWNRKDYHSDPLAGGDFDKTPYNKIVYARAIINYYKEIKGMNIQNEVKDYTVRNRKKYFIRYLIIFLAFLLVWVLGVKYEPFLKELVNNEFTWQILSKMSDSLAIGSFLWLVFNFIRKKE